jgi:hypothetical protein
MFSQKKVSKGMRDREKKKEKKRIIIKRPTKAQKY